VSELHPGARHVDPLDALRAADHRPIHEVWRERLADRARGFGVSVSIRPLVIVVVGVLLAGVVWQLFVATEPPVENTIPLAQATPISPSPSPSSFEAQEQPDDLVRSAAPVDGQANKGDPVLLVVHVAGAVQRPGLVSGQDGWRIDDVVRAAGGAAPTADLDRLNLAEFVSDGQRVYVPVVGETEPAIVRPTGGSRQAAGDVSVPTVINVNTADAATLQTLPGIGPATASTIIEHRDQHGHFADVEALVAVRGIGPATLEALRDRVRTS